MRHVYRTNRVALDWNEFGAQDSNQVCRNKTPTAKRMQEQEGEWEKTAECMMLNFAESGHLVFRATSALERRELKSNGKGVKSIHFNGSDDTIELILRTINSVNQLSVFGAATDFWRELARNSRGTKKPAANEKKKSMVRPKEFRTANPLSHTDDEVQGGLLREYDQKFAELLEQQKLTKLCSNAGFSTNIEKGHFFITLDDDALDDVKGPCPRVYFTSKWGIIPRGCIRGNTKIGSVLDVKVWYHQGRYGVEIMIESFFRDRTISWVRIVNGLIKFGTEMSEEMLVTSVENRGTGKLVAKAKPRPKPTFTLSPVSILYRYRKWIDVEPGNSVKVVLKCQNLWSDCCDMMTQFIEKMMEL